MNLDKHTVVGLCVITLQGLGHAITFTGTKDKQSTYMYGTSYVAQALYKKLDAIRITAPMEQARNGEIECLDYYSNYSDPSLYNTLTVPDNELHYLHAVIKFLLSTTLDADQATNSVLYNMGRDVVEKERKEIIQKLLRMYTVYEGRYISGESILVMQYETPNTTNTAISIAKSLGIIRTDIDDSTRHELAKIMHKYLQSTGSGKLVINLDENAGIGKRVGMLMQQALKFNRGDLRFRHTDFIKSNDEETPSGSSDQIHGSVRAKFISDELNVNVMDIKRAVQICDEAYFGQNRGEDETMLIRYMMRGLEKPSLTRNEQKSNKIRSVVNSLSELIEEGIKNKEDILTIHKRWCARYKGEQTLSSNGKNNSSGFVDTAPSIREYGETSKHIVQVFTHHYIAVLLLTNLIAKLEKHGYTFASTRLYPVDKISGYSLVQHLQVVFGEDVAFPLTDPALALAIDLIFPVKVDSKDFHKRIEKLCFTNTISLNNLTEVKASDLYKIQSKSPEEVVIQSSLLLNDCEKLFSVTVTDGMSGKQVEFNREQLVSTLFTLEKKLTSQNYTGSLDLFNDSLVMSWFAAMGHPLQGLIFSYTDLLLLMQSILEPIYNPIMTTYGIPYSYTTIGYKGVINLIQNFINTCKFSPNDKNTIDNVNFGDSFQVIFAYIYMKLNYAELPQTLSMGNLDADACDNVMRKFSGSASVSMNTLSSLYSSVESHYSTVKEKLGLVDEAYSAEVIYKLKFDSYRKEVAKEEFTPLTNSKLIHFLCDLQTTYGETYQDDDGFFYSKETDLPCSVTRNGASTFGVQTDLYEIKFINAKREVSWKPILQQDLKLVQRLTMRI